MTLRVRLWLRVVGWLAISLLPGQAVAIEPGTAAVGLQPIISSGLQHPTYLTHAGDGSGRLFVVEQPGRILVIHNGALLPKPFLDITDRVLSSGAEQGLLGLAFHPKFPHNGRYVINYTRVPDGATVVAEYHVSEDLNSSRTDEKTILLIPQPYPNHNGGMVQFGQDGLLYIGMGDGGSRGDPENRGQNTQELLGKILRIDVEHGASYGIPPDNPFARGGGRPEIFASGFRNPWRFSFDRDTGELWVADVGQNAWEEIDVVRRGGNYGWRIMEGAHCFMPPRACATEGLIFPVAEYPTRSPRCAITGGYIYRGKNIPSLRAAYIYGDYCSGEIMAWDGREQRRVLSTGRRISSFGEDASGELYVVGHQGSIDRIVPSAQSLPSTQ